MKSVSSVSDPTDDDGPGWDREPQRMCSCGSLVNERITHLSEGGGRELSKE